MSAFIHVLFGLLALLSLAIMFGLLLLTLFTLVKVALAAFGGRL